MRTSWYVIVIIAVVGSAASTFADIGWADSPLFHLDLLTVQPGGGCAWADSPLFHLDLLTVQPGGGCAWADSGVFSAKLYPVHRGWADSGGFEFNWLANCNPASGPAQDGGEAPQNDFLKQLDATGAWVDAFGTPANGGTAVIINHGWNSSPERMLDLAMAIASEEEVPDAYIYSWDWGDGPDAVSDANPNGKSLAGDFAELLGCADGTLSCMLSATSFAGEVENTKNNAYSHGRQLGDVLIAYGILPDRCKIHMIGHSFGGIVCAEAAKKLYNKTGVRIKQLTTLETPRLFWPNALSAVDPSCFERVEVIYYDWRDELLLGATGGPLGGGYDNVLNLELNPSFNYLFPLHTKAVDWYEVSVSATAINCEDNRYGFGWSFAIDPFDPYWDIWGNKKELWGYGRGCLLSWGDVAEAATDAVVETVKDGFETAAEWVGKGAEVVVDNVGSAFNSALKLTLTPPVILLKSGEKGMFAAMEATEPNAAYIYREMDVPIDAEQVVFDLRFETVGAGDILTLSIGNKVLITIDAEATGVSENYTHSYPASVREYAGQTVLLQIMLRPTGEGTTTVFIDNLRFIKLTIPGDLDGDKAVGLADLVIMSEQWLLSPSELSADIAPVPEGDNMVNTQDFSIMAENWQIDVSGAD